MLIKKTFCKEERLCSKVLLQALFTSGSSFLIYPYRVSWLIATQTQNFPVQIVIGVSKKKFKLSVDRNFIKRKIKEAYRLNKQELLYNPLITQDSKILLSINYIGKDVVPQNILEAKIKAIFLNLLLQIKSDND